MKQDINLFQAIPKKPRLLLSSNNVLLGVVLFSLGLMGFYAYSYLPIRSLEEELQQVSAQKQTAKQDLANLKQSLPKSTKNAELEEKMEQLSAILPVAEQLVEILENQSEGNINGFVKHLEGLARQHIDRLWLTKISLRAGGTALNLHGQTLEPNLVPRFITALTQESAFQQIRFQQIKLERTDELSQSLTFVLDTTASIPPKESKKESDQSQEKIISDLLQDTLLTFR